MPGQFLMLRPNTGSPTFVIRNLAIIAHVDHGKTTLVDKMLRQAGAFRANQQVDERVMDSNPLERERGITILAKNTAVRWHGTKINIVDTPGHADFGGEVERILRMVDGVLILVDAAEGPDAADPIRDSEGAGAGAPADRRDQQDRPGGCRAAPRARRSARAVHRSRGHPRAARRAIPLYVEPGRHRDRRADRARERISTPLFQAILDYVPEPRATPTGRFRCWSRPSIIRRFSAGIAIGRIERGRVRVGDQVALLPLGEPGLVTRRGVRAEQGDQAVIPSTASTGSRWTRSSAGDIVALSGFETIEIGKTFTAVDTPERLAGIAVEEPTISVDFIVNNSPFAGRDGKFVTSRQLRDRLFRELERNVALRVEETDSPDTHTVSGRGELHLGILMETMRREGYEFQVSRPRVITRLGPDGERLEPYEELTIDVAEEYMGA